MTQPKPYPKNRTKREAMVWLFITAINDHIMRCESAKFPDEHPICQEKCCPNCCGTCFTLRWFRDQEDRYLMRMLNQYGEGLWTWQMADGSVDWSQIEAHWDDSGATCGRTKCFQETAMRNGMGLLTEAELRELGAV
jgi:hypothetical protein